MYTGGVRRTELPVRAELPGDELASEQLSGIISECLAQPDTYVWLGLSHPTRVELALVSEAFQLDPLHVEDAMNPQQLTKHEESSHYDFFVLKILTYVEASSDVETGQLAIFIGEKFLLTIRLGPLGHLDNVRTAVEAQPDRLIHGPISALHAIVDHIADRYIDVAEEINHDIEGLEEQVFSPMPSDPEAVYRLKRENLELRRATVPMLRITASLTTLSRPDMTAIFGPLFADVRDHLHRVKDTAETNDDMLMALLMASTARQDLQQNRDMRKISAWVAIAAVPTMIAGVYGMNFDNMPELHEIWGYPAVLLLMVTVCSMMYRGFRRSGWL